MRCRWLIPVALLSSLSLACGGGTPPPRPPEEPIDTQASNREAKRPPPEEGEEVSLVRPPPSSDSSGSGGSGSGATGSGTSTGGGNDNAATATGTGKKGDKGAPPPPDKGGGKKGLTKAQCDQMIDKYVELVVAGNGPLKGTTGPDLENAKAMIRQMTATDPNMQGLQASCQKDGTRQKYSCSMNARTAEEWQGCVR